MNHRNRIHRSIPSSLPCRPLSRTSFCRVCVTRLRVSKPSEAFFFFFLLFLPPPLPFSFSLFFFFSFNFDLKINEKRLRFFLFFLVNFQIIHEFFLSAIFFSFFKILSSFMPILCFDIIVILISITLWQKL